MNFTEQKENFAKSAFRAGQKDEEKTHECPTTPWVLLREVAHDIDGHGDTEAADQGQDQ